MKLVLLFLTLVMWSCGDEKEKEIEVSPSPNSKAPTASSDLTSSSPQYLVTITDDKGNVLSTRYDNSDFKGTDEEFAAYELKNKDINKVNVKVLNSDSELESSTDSCFYYVSPYYYYRPTTSYYYPSSYTSPYYYYSSYVRYQPVRRYYYPYRARAYPYRPYRIVRYRRYR